MSKAALSKPIFAPPPVQLPQRNAAQLAQQVVAQPPPPTRVGSEVLRQQLDRIDLPVGPGPVELRVTDDMQQALEQYAYQRRLAGMSDEELAAEIARQDERQLESTTGHDRDPEEAADAKWRSRLAWAELNRRQLANPELPLEDYENRLGWLSDAELRREEQRLVAAIDDARSGPHVNEADATALEERLAAVHSEQAQRVVDDPKTPMLQYYAALKNLSDGALTAEVAQVQAEYDALQAELKANPSIKVFAQLAALGPRLAALNAEMERRGLSAAEPEAPVAEEPEAPVEEPAPAEQPVPAEEPSPAEAPASEPYTVQEGDMLWLIAQRISDQHGGTPSQEQVMADLLKLNALPNPDLILVGQVLQVPVYP